MKILKSVASLTLTVVLLSACTQETVEDPAIQALRAAAEMEKQMDAAIDASILAWDTGNTDGLDAVMASGIIRTAPDQSVSNLDDYKAFIAEAHKVYPDFSITNDGTAVGLDGGFVQWTVTGTDSGSASPTGNKVKVIGITRYNFEDGKISSELVIFDTGSLLSQLGREDLPRDSQ